MLRAYKYRLYPSTEQAEFFAKSFGCCRVVYNRTLDYMSMMWSGCGVNVERLGAQAQLPSLKEIYPWLGEVNSQSLQYAVKQVVDGYRNWWEHRTKHPHLKNKHSRQSFHNPQHCSVDWRHRTLTIPKCSNISIVLHRPFYGKIQDVAISREPDGRYYASILVDTALKEICCQDVEISTTIGIDTGIKTFAVCSDGREFATPHFARAQEKRLKRYQRQFRLKEKGSRNREKQNRKIARIYSHISNQRLDYIHKVTYELTHDSQVHTICIEDLNVKGMMKNHHLAYSLADASIGKFYDILAYKCKWYGVNLVTIGRWDASSKTCSVCGNQYRKLKLSERNWTCSNCGTRHDRDLNAARNIRNFGVVRALPPDRREVTPVDCPPVDDRRLADLKSRDRENQEKICGVTDAPVL